MTLYFGTPGNLIALQDPKGGIQMTRRVERASFQLDSGGVRIARTVAGRRRFVLSYQNLTKADLVTLQEYEQGHKGPGPWVFWDTNQVNLLTVRQSSATSSTGDTSGFSVQYGTGTINTQPAAYLRGPRSLQWYWSGAASSHQVIRLDPVTTLWNGIPVMHDLSYTWSFYVRAYGGDQSVAIEAQIEWYNSVGAIVLTSQGGEFFTVGTAYNRWSVTETAPSTAVFARPVIHADGATILSEANLSIDQLQFEQAASRTTWVPGAGVYPVDFIEDVPDNQPWQMPAYRSAPVVTLQEVG